MAYPRCCTEKKAIDGTHTANCIVKTVFQPLFFLMKTKLGTYTANFKKKKEIRF
jgi:hypothetical protein